MDTREIRRTCSLLVERGHLEASKITTLVLAWKRLAHEQPTLDLPGVLLDLGYVTQDQLPSVRELCEAATLARQPTGGPQVFKVEEPAVEAPEGFERYELLEELQRGGMGVVYKARHRALDSVVALKVLLAGMQSDEARSRFRQEARVLAKLKHPNIVGVSDLGEEEGRLFYVMDLVRGRNLRQVYDEREGLGVRWCLGVIAEVAQALDFCHRNGVVHRDVKPTNIIVEEQKGIPVLVDFGVARCEATPSSDSGSRPLEDVEDALGDEETRGGALSRSFVTAAGHVVGTPHYMAPEQISAELGEVGPRSDIYSLAATLYYALTGRPPFRSSSLVRLLTDVMHREPKPIRSINPKVPAAVAKVCHLALSKDPRDRPASAVLFAEALTRALEERVEEAAASSESARLRVGGAPKSVRGRGRTGKLEIKWTVETPPAPAALASAEEVAPPAEFKAHLRRGNRLFKRGKFSAAIEELNQAIWVWPDGAVAFVNRGAAHYKLKDYDAAIDDFTAALMLDPDDVDALRRRGRAHFKRRDFASAVDDFGQVIRLAPDDADAYHKRSVAYHRLGDPKRAAADEERSKLLAAGGGPEKQPSAEADPLAVSAGDGPEPVTVLTLRGMLDNSTSGRLEEVLGRLILEGHARVLVDCSDLTHVDSRSASIFLSQLRPLRLAGGDLKLFGLSDRARAALDTLGLAELIHMEFADRAAALSAFEQPLPSAWRDAAREGWVGLLNSHAFHRPGCDQVKGQDPAFQVWFETEDEAVLAGRSRCGECS